VLAYRRVNFAAARVTEGVIDVSFFPTVREDHLSGANLYQKINREVFQEGADPLYSDQAIEEEGRSLKSPPDR
jgi:hypothetical protein